MLYGANSYVNKNCLGNKIYFGNPAKYQEKKKMKANLEDNLNLCLIILYIFLT